MFALYQIIMYKKRFRLIMEIPILTRWYFNYNEISVLIGKVASKQRFKYTFLFNDKFGWSKIKKNS